MMASTISTARNAAMPSALKVQVAARIRTIGASGLAVGVLLYASLSHAGTASSLRLAGHVPPRASVWLSSWSASSINLLAPAQQRLKLADLFVSANNRHFTVSLVSTNADAAGNPALIDPETGSMLAYAVALGPSRPDVAIGANPAAAQAVEMVLPQTAGSVAGSYQDRLLLVIKAR